ncbi:MAG: ATP-dependent DNA helicase RecG [Nitratireductor sp.]
MRPDILNPLFAPVSKLEGIGPKLEKALTKLFRGNEALDPARIADLVFHAPHSVIDRTNMPSIEEAMAGEIVTLKVHIDAHLAPPRGNKRVPYRVNVHDQSGELQIAFFRAHGSYLEKQLPVGGTRYISGRVERFNGRASMVHPDLILDEQAFSAMPLIEPVYPAVSGIAQKTLAKSIRTSVELLPDFEEWADKALMAKEKWPDFSSAVKALHRPRDVLDVDARSKHRRRLAFDEFLAGQLALALMRERMKKTGGKSRNFSGNLKDNILKQFKWPLTNSQSTAISDIRQDLEKDERMLRLLQGDVGSGKTIVALCAAANVIESGSQAAIMAPTEILARQHFATIKPLCDAVGINVEILTSNEKGQIRAGILERLKSGETQLLLGTHALFQGPVEFKELGLAVIDEQHRFGVHQRLALGDKGPQTDVLVMTATPIPRTLVMTWYGDMDVSQLTDKPIGRKDINTTLLSSEKLDVLINRVGTALADNKKLYWVCPLVEDSEEVNATSAQTRFEALHKQFGDKVGLVHGRMRAEEKSAVMEAFRDGSIRLLVATTVIEVGVDVPDATIMIIENAERFGLAQLHQLRGRVGRSDLTSNCILLYQAPQNAQLGEVSKARLNVMRDTNDGFVIAEKDLELRGEGEVLGTRQSGTPGFSLADPEAHKDILEIARDQARYIVATNPNLDGSQGAALRVMLYLFGQDQAIRLLRSG